MAESFTRAFAGGELTPEFWGRIDDAKFQTGLALCRNFEVLPHGPVRNRAGTQFVRAVKDSTRRTRLLPFVYSTTQTMVLEVGHQYIRFHTQGATLLSGGVPYEVATPYAEADLFDLHYVQSADVLTIVHPGYAPRELRRLGPTSWALTTITFSSSLAAPTSVSATPTVGSVSPGPATTQSYVVTAVGADGLDESVASAAATCSNNLYDSDARNTISWTASAGAARYNVYRLSNGLYGYIGQTTSTTLVDQGGGDVVAPDLGKTPPIFDAVFSTTGDYPGAVSYYEQRRVFAGTTNAPQTLWATKSGTESNMSYSLPTLDNDRIKFRVAAREANTIRHIVPLQQLVLLTSAAEWRVTSVNSDAVTPASVSVKPQSYVGANGVQPVLVNNNLLYAAARGGHVREMAYSWQANGYVTGDASLRAPHLFDGFDIVDMAYVKAPYPIVWAVSSSGKLLGLTYVPEQQVGAWHQHDTRNGAFESVAAVAEGNEDVLYAVVRRTLGGATVRTVERMHSRAFSAQADAYFVDCGLTYTGAPATVISGLDHLEGETVSILGDGAVVAPQVVSGGSITLPEPCSTVHVGLAITADLVTLPIALQNVEGFAQDRPLNVNRVHLRVYQSSGIFAGPSFDKLVEAKQRTTEPYGVAPYLKTSRVKIDLTPTWGEAGQVCIRQSDPLPLTVLSMTINVAMGGG